MKLRSHASEDPFDGLTAEDIRRIRGGAAASVTPGMENFPTGDHSEHFVRNHVTIERETIDVQPKRKRGRRT